MFSAWQYRSIENVMNNFKVFENIAFSNLNLTDIFIYLRPFPSDKKSLKNNQAL